MPFATMLPRCCAARPRRTSRISPRPSGRPVPRERAPFHSMKLFIDTADIGQIKEAWSWGIIDGVTTNPTHVMKTGRKPDEVYREILDIVDGPISLETIATEHKAIVAEGKALAKLHKNVVVKVPVIREGLKA